MIPILDDNPRLITIIIMLLMVLLSTLEDNVVIVQDDGLTVPVESATMGTQRQQTCQELN